LFSRFSEKRCEGLRTKNLDRVGRERASGDYFQTWQNLGADFPQAAFVLQDTF